MRVLGHRGSAATHPENTLESFRAALAAGAAGFECDVRSSADGELVLAHDATLERTTDGEGRIDRTAAAALAGLDAGYRFTADGITHPFRGAGLGIPTLAAALDEFAEAEINVELKGMPGDEGYDPAEPVARALAWALAGRDTSRIIVSSFNPVALAVFRQVAPGVRTGVLGPDWLDPAVVVSLAVEGGHDGCHVHHSRLDGDVAAAIKDAGRFIVAWTVNDPARALELRDLGVAAVITDDPRRIVEALG